MQNPVRSLESSTPTPRRRIAIFDADSSLFIQYDGGGGRDATERFLQNKKHRIRYIHVDKDVYTRGAFPLAFGDSFEIRPPIVTGRRYCFWFFFYPGISFFHTKRSH